MRIRINKFLFSIDKNILFSIDKNILVNEIDNGIIVDVYSKK